ncbi:3816_t:CDS:2 [Paraglomus brasilianum]|uniref:3816_t:CDS:1 n=1 Tax=Paraglomus brasilianum TaxID=144538 RepID=A0A9N8WP90_9GLOM|nr:3816_t:CDS:2 [Paraglomus brasilianum]
MSSNQGILKDRASLIGAFSPGKASLPTGFGDIKKFIPEVTQQNLETTESEESDSDSSADSSEESVSTDSSITRVAHYDSTRPKVVDNMSQEPEEVVKRPRAKVNMDNIIGYTRPQPLTQSGLQMLGGVSNNRFKAQSELVRRSDSVGHTKGRPLGDSQTMLDDGLSSYKPQALVRDVNPPRYHSSSRSDTSWNSDSGKNDKWSNNRQIDDQPSRRPFVRTPSIINDPLPNYSSIGRNRQSQSEVVYRRPTEAPTEVSRVSDPGQGQPVRRPTVKVSARLNEDSDNLDNNQYGKMRPRVSVSAMVELNSNKTKRKVVQDIGSASDEESGSTEESGSSEDESGANNEEDNFESLINIKIQQEVQELKVSNESLLASNAELEAKFKEQADKIAELSSLSSVVAEQQEKLETIKEVEEIVKSLKMKITAAEEEIVNLKKQAAEKTDDKQKTRMAFFVNPRSLPLNRLPPIIFDRGIQVFLLYSFSLSIILCLAGTPFSISCIIHTAIDLTSNLSFRSPRILNSFYRQLQSTTIA